MSEIITAQEMNNYLTTNEQVYRRNLEAQETYMMQHAKAPKTLKAYRLDWEDFSGWCEEHHYKPLPADTETVRHYLTHCCQLGLKVSTITRRLSSISQAHQASKLVSPTQEYEIRTYMAAIRRELGAAQKGKAAAVTEDIRSMVSVLPESLLGIRDRALLLLGFSGAFRRSELVSLDYEDLEFTREGVIIHLQKSKTDQEGKGMEKGIPYGSHLETCPVRSLQSWLEVSGITSGPLFRSINRHSQIQPGRLSDKAVALVVKRYAKAAGLDEKNYSGHSLRAGLATSAAKNQVNNTSIMAQTGHKSEAMLRRYIRHGSLFTNNAAAMVGL